MDEPSDLVTLKALLADIPDTADRLGLLFHSRLAGPVYDETPRNCVPFASTGGDGVHFSYLLTDDEPNDSSPIVMTVPCAMEPNRVVGRNLRNFLGLGLHSGYFMLEQLQYDFADTVSALDRRVLDHPEPAAAQALAAIAEHMQVIAWHDHGAMLLELEAEFAGQLDIAPFE